jgi:predicted hotdog family 3-hydroxylacyl-ACP dehydratase
MIGADEIRRLVPHAGGMCLLETVVEWNDDGLVCATTTHRRADHPLRRDGKLAAVHLIEYGAQAAAVHGGLLGQRDGAGAKPGMLTALRDCRLHVARIDDVDATLTVRARKLAASAEGSIYQFEISAAGRMLAEGRVTIATTALPSSG